MSDFVKMQIDLAKPVAAGAGAYLIDTMYFKTPMNRAVPFAVATAFGIYLGSIIGNFTPDLTMGLLPNGKSIEQRVIEIASGTGVSYSINKFYLKNDFNSRQMMERVAAIAICDVLGEYTGDYISGRPLSFFN
jgi:hypothetical protein